MGVEQVTMNVLKDVANSVMSFLRFTTEVSTGPECPIPCLDTQIWVGKPSKNGTWYSHNKDGETAPGGTSREEEPKNILYKFYSKSMANPLTILKRSVMPEGVKVALFSNEILRRLKTTSTLLSSWEFESVLNNFMDNLDTMGYKVEWRKKILRSSLVGYMRILDKVEKGETTRNRKGDVTLMSRRFKRILGIQEWYKVDRDREDAEEIREPLRYGQRGRKSVMTKSDRYVESVIFVPHTPNGELKLDWLGERRR